VWIVVSEGDLASLRAGVPSSLVAAGVSLALSPGRAPSVSLPGLVRFIGFFLVHSVRGGIDVAMRAIKPSLPIDPGTVTYRLRIEPVSVRVLFVNTLSLLPGTLSTHLDGDELIVHVLDCRGPVISDIEIVERRLADVFNITLRSPIEERA